MTLTGTAALCREIPGDWGPRALYDEDQDDPQMSHLEWLMFKLMLRLFLNDEKRLKIYIVVLVVRAAVTIRL